jgi:hypothetical protein
MPLKRLYQLEREYRVLLKQITETMSLTDLGQLKKHRNEIVAEARQILNKMNAPSPQWHGAR